jgi:hypothetical protein
MLPVLVASKSRYGNGGNGVEAIVFFMRAKTSSPRWRTTEQS